MRSTDLEQLFGAQLRDSVSRYRAVNLELKEYHDRPVAVQKPTVAKSVYAAELSPPHVAINDFVIPKNRSRKMTASENKN